MLALRARIGLAASSHAGRDHRFDERGHDGLGQRDIDRPIERDDAAEGGEAVRFAGAHVRIDRGAADCGAARVRVLDDRRRRLVEFEDDAQRGVEIEQVRVRQLLALQDCRPHRVRPGSRLTGVAGTYHAAR